MIDQDTEMVQTDPPVGMVQVGVGIEREPDDGSILVAEQEVVDPLFDPVQHQV